jgi:hypothetical protein
VPKVRLPSEHSAGKLAWRFATGAPMDGHPRTDATWFSSGHAVAAPYTTARRWDYRPRAQRAAIRWACTVGAVGWLVGYTNAPELTLALTFLVMAAGVGRAGWRAWQRWKMRQHNRRYVRPLHTALAPQVGILPTSRPDDWLSVPVDFSTREDAEIVITFPPGFTGSADVRKLVNGIVADKLGLPLSDTDVFYHMVGERPFAVFKLAPKPPSKVLFDAFRPFMESTPESAPGIGLGRRSKLVSVDLDAESPHVLISMSSGGGKSVLTRTIACQLLHNGAFGLILDIKRHSHSWARGLPNVRYCRDIEDIHNALIWAAEEGERRNRETDDSGGVYDGPRLFIIAEEMNATVGRLMKYWRNIREKDDPKTSPAVEALGDIAFMGRAVKLHLLAIAQLMTARTLGGPETRENFATRILARYTVNAWKMLVPEVTPIPKASRKAGRVQVVLGGEADETQVAFLTDEQARDWALSGIVAADPMVPASQVPAPPTTLGQQPGTVPTPDPNERPALRVVRDPADELVGLREAVKKGFLMPLVQEANQREPNADAGRLEDLAVQVLQAARKRDKEFPESRGYRGQEKLYRVGDLQFWMRNRPKAGERRVSGE